MIFIPGRIEVLGKHTDYCGGRSLVCAIDRGFSADIDARTDGVVELENRDTGETVRFDLSDPSAPRGHWLNYAVEVARRVTGNFVGRDLTGCAISFSSDLPKAAGLSSSSALMIMVFAALDAVNDLRSTETYRENIYDDTDLAEYLGCVENGQSYRGLAGSAGVGTFGGSQDHAAITLGKRGMLSQFGFSPLRHEADIAFPADLAFVVAASGVAAEKTGAALNKYNRMSRMAAVISSEFGGKPLAAVIQDLGIDGLRQLINTENFDLPSDDLLKRVDHFYAENFQIIPAVAELIAAGNYCEIGPLIDLSQRNAERLLGNQVEETVFLQRSSRDLGSIAASAFGAGFGGSVYSIVERRDAERFASRWKEKYLDKFPQHRSTSEFFLTGPSECRLG